MELRCAERRTIAQASGKGSLLILEARGDLGHDHVAILELGVARTHFSDLTREFQVESAELHPPNP